MGVGDGGAPKWEGGQALPLPTKREVGRKKFHHAEGERWYNMFVFFLCFYPGLVQL